MYPSCQQLETRGQYLLAELAQAGGGFQFTEKFGASRASRL